MTSSKTPRKNKSGSRKKPSPPFNRYLIDDRAEQGGRYLRVVSRKSLPKKEK